MLDASLAASHTVTVVASSSDVGFRDLLAHYHALCAAIDRTMALYRQPEEWRRLQQNGMAADFSWAASGRAYAELYRELTGKT